MGLSIWQIAIVAILIILLFGRGKLSGLMTDLADGIKSFRRGIKEAPEDSAQFDGVADQRGRVDSNSSASAQSQPD